MESFDKEDIIADKEIIQPTDDCNTCEVCAKSFSTKAFLKQHRIIYEHLEVFPCLVCKKTFSLASSLKNYTNVTSVGDSSHPSHRLSLGKAMPCLAWMERISFV